MNQDSLSQPAISASLSALPQAINSWLDSAPHPYDKNSAPLFGSVFNLILLKFNLIGQFSIYLWLVVMIRDVIYSCFLQ